MSRQLGWLQSRRPFWVLLLGAAAYLTNLAPVPLSFGLDFLFGSLFAVLASILLGPWAGAVAGFLSALPTVQLWGHPFAVLSMTLEAWVVGYEARRGGLHHTQSDLLYWIFLGAPLVLLTYTVWADISLMAAGVAALKQSVNGVLNTSIASVLALVASRRPQGEWRLPLEVFLSRLITCLVLLPLAISFNWTVRESGSRLRSQISGEAVRAGDVVKSALEREIADGRGAMRSLAHLVEVRLVADPALVGSRLDEVLPPGVQAFWLVDAAGNELVRVSAGSDEPLPVGDDLPVGQVVNLTGATGKALILEEPVTLRAPYGEGRAVAALDLQWIGDRILAEIEALNMEVAVSDSRNEIMFATWEGVAGHGQFVSDLGEVAFFQAADRAPVEGTRLQLAEQLVFVHRTEGREFGWQVYVRKPLGVVEDALYRSYQRSYVSALVLITLLIGAIRLLSYIITRPLVQLAGVVVTPEGELTNLPSESPIWVSEVWTVIAHLEEVGERIRGLVGSLQESRRKLEQDNVELAVANLHLAEEATRDPETGLLNQRAFQRQIGLWVEENRPFTLVLVEPQGDKLRATTSDLHQGAQMHGGEAYRLGGGRLALLFPTADPWHINRVNQALFLTERPSGVQPRFGTASFPADGQTAPAIMETAERQLNVK